jgi:hypothetical protein
MQKQVTSISGFSKRKKSGLPTNYDIINKKAKSEEWVCTSLFYLCFRMDFIFAAS